MKFVTHLLRIIMMGCLLLAGGKGYAQICSVNNNDTIICAGTTVSFTLTIAGGTPVSYAWNFGNGFTANTADPSHTYTTAGIFTPTVVITFQGGLTCNASGKPILVRATPVADFKITTARQMCFKGNELCIVDYSTAGPSNAPIKQRVFQLSNGYLQIDTPPYVSQICYVNTTDVLGHTYSLVVEVTDTNNCVSRLLKKDSVELYPKFEQLSFDIDTVYHCDVTKANFTNTSLIPFSRVKKFKWVFGDGTTDSTNWVSVSHDYRNIDTCYPMLVVIDNQNCIDTFISKVYVSVFNPNRAIYISTPSTQCYRDNVFGFESKNENVDFSWDFFDANGNPVSDIIVDRDSMIFFQAITCGMFKVRLTITRLSCVVVTDSIIHVMGPRAIIDDIDHRVVNARQCSILDTVYFKTPVPYLSCTYKNGAGMKHLWNFDDAFAPQCTLDTRKGINIGLNCNFSRDSMVVKHFYTPGKERCYNVSLYMIDTISGCDHTTFKALPLMAPDASPDTTAVPKRKGLQFFGGNEVHCLNQLVTFDFRDLLPGCDYTSAYLYADSACDTCGWIPMDTWGLGIYGLSYSGTADSNGYVTVGLIIGNGNPNGVMCYDTAWYHYFMRLLPIRPEFKIAITPSCGPYYIEVIPLTTIQYNLKKVTWVLGYDSIVQVFGPNDSIVLPQQFTVPNKGVNAVSVVYENINGCSAFELERFSVGSVADFGPSKLVVCNNDSVDFYSNIHYYNWRYRDLLDTNEYWYRQSRSDAGKEVVWWNVGDGNGYVLAVGSASIKYPAIGQYTVSMIYQDSNGCKDTVIKNNLIAVVGLEADMEVLQQQYYCAPQIVVFNNHSIVYDSLPIGGPSGYDEIIDYQWKFGDNTAESGLREPAHNYTRNGVFDVMMVVTTRAGCKDTDYTQVSVTGPIPSFTIQDTLGCVPFTVVLDNTTGKALKSWTWYFGDSANQTLTTLSDNSIQFTYTKPGTYDIRLLGSQDVTNPSTGNTINCNAFFPDPVTNSPVRRVYVQPILPVKLDMEDSVCVGQEVFFTSRSDSSYTKLLWQISGGDSMVITNPNSVTTYQFNTIGLFTVFLMPLENPTSTCWDTASAQIRSMEVKADFEIDSTQVPVFRFRNTSSGATRYVWNFGKPPLGAANTSQLVNAECNFGNDTGTYEVCLMAFNAIDCDDSVCKTVRINQTRLIIPNVFTPGNNDGYNDAFDIDILGFTEYHLVVYNRWGTLVYESLQDGHQNDGINWNGNDHQTGPPCADGTYYYLFTYKFYSESESKSVHGTITLIRD